MNNKFYEKDIVVQKIFIKMLLKKLFFISLFFISSVFVFCEKIPKEKLLLCSEYRADIVAEVKKVGGQNLSNDSFFLKTLKNELNNSSRSTEDKVYYFYEMLDSFDWAFCGALKGFPLSHHYAEELIFRGVTYTDYRKKLKSEGFDSSPYFELFHKYKEQKPILSAYSLLLGCLIEKDDVILSKTLENILNSEVYNASPAFASLIFHDAAIISLIVSCSSYSYDATDILRTLFDVAQKEEEKEDLIIALCYAENKNVIKNAFDAVLTIKDSEFDFVVKSFFKSVQMRHEDGVSKTKEKKEFKKLVNLYLETSEEEWQKKLAKSIIDCNYQFGYMFQTQAEANKKTDRFTKIWDNFSITVYSDGMLVFYDDYAQFMPLFDN